jgi:hypothetical protein
VSTRAEELLRGGTLPSEKAEIVAAFLQDEGWPTYAEIVSELVDEIERQTLLNVRTFITKHGVKEVDAYCAQRLHDIRMDARHREKAK